MKYLFEAESAQQRFDHVFDIYTGFFVQKDWNEINNLFDYCVAHPEEVEWQPDVLMTLLLLSKNIKELDCAKRLAAYGVLENIYFRNFKGQEKQFKAVMLGLK